MKWIEKISLGKKDIVNIYRLKRVTDKKKIMKAKKLREKELREAARGNKESESGNKYIYFIYIYIYKYIIYNI